jgi:hypothetical protein
MVKSTLVSFSNYIFLNEDHQTALIRAVNVALRHVLVNKPMYEEMLTSNQKFLTMLCSKLDLMDQIFLRSCCDAKSREDVS